MQSQAKMAGAMGSTAKAMASVNAQIKVEDIARTMQTFERETGKMDLAGEMSESESWPIVISARDCHMHVIEPWHLVREA